MRLAEVIAETQHTYLDQLRHVARAVAETFPLRDIGGGYARCFYCGNEYPVHPSRMDPVSFPHRSDCAWVVAKELDE